MVVISFADVLLRYFFDKPIKGVYSITEVMLIMVVFLGLAYTQSEKGHVSIDVITSRLSSRTRLVWDNVLLLLAM
jgi:TRAP-type C4-dicarboxylate transport system permease small subunit